MSDKKPFSTLPSLDEITADLCKPESFRSVYHRPKHDQPMPSVDTLVQIVERLKAVLFPGFFGNAEVTPENMHFHVGHNLDIVHRLLWEQINRGHCFSCPIEGPVPAGSESCMECEERAKDQTMRFLAGLPEMRTLLAGDVNAAFVGDPAAKKPGDTIFCYPSITALTHHRIAHALYKLNVDLIPRIISELAHSATGIDIHPGATIGSNFFIDHGTGVVVGETCIIGDNVRLYQGVTLGAKSFPKDDNGTLIKGIARHPVVEDDVIIYAGATILGRITIGKGSVVGGNVWLTEDLPPHSVVIQSPAGETRVKNMLGEKEK